MTIIEKAIELAKMIHSGQVYKHPDGDRDYFEYHIKNVWARVADSDKNGNGDFCIVSILHDVLEDCHKSDKAGHNAFIKETFGERIWMAVNILDKDKTEYSEYINRVAGNKLARVVKIFDLRENMLHCLLPNATEYAKTILYQKYLMALYHLEIR